MSNGASTSPLDPNRFSSFTQSVISSVGPSAPPRIKSAFPILIKKLHEACVEANVTTDELMKICDILISAGKISNEKRNEMLLVTDIFGIESLADMLTHEQAALKAQASSSGVPSENTDSAILGPFYREGVPVQPNGTSIIRHPEPNAQLVYLYGKVTDSDGNALESAEVDVWEDAPDGYYDSQTPDKPQFHCRGRFKTDPQGNYDFVCLKPTPYPVPSDHQAGFLLKLMDRHPYRPAHIHFKASHPTCHSLVTQVFDVNSDYLKNDTVFAVKNKLVVEFKKYEGDKKGDVKGEEKEIEWELHYDIKLVKNV